MEQKLKKHMKLRSKIQRFLLAFIKKTFLYTSMQNYIDFISIFKFYISELKAEFPEGYSISYLSSM